MNLKRNFIPVGIIAIVSLAALAFYIPATGSASPANNQIPGFADAQTLNVTNSSFANKTTPRDYRITQTPIQVEVKYEGTLAGAKGEMAAGPRTIGFSIPPGSLIVIVIAAVALVAGVFGTRHFMKQKRNEEEDQNEEDEGK